ncbi:MAG TPA: beta-propeller domain-containing protein, methanol dehydrogenase, partial [Clostridium sp.]|nr:beta-propeller domain-containing protein, methanol dehydrogenase [Clostridium sp.]
DANKIVSLGKELEDKTGAQAVVVVMNTLNNTPIEDYSNSLFRTWGIGEKGKDNGLLILVAIDDRQWRVEVGRGLEGAIPDALSSRVMTSIAKPSFKNGNYSEGILNSYSVLCDYASEEYGVTLDKSLNVTMPSEEDYEDNDGFNIFIFIAIIVIVFIDSIFNRGRLLRMLFWTSRGGRGPRGGGGFGGFGG